MSLILEALKKSEQQRRLGEAPNLGTPIVLTRRRSRLLPLLAGAIALALGLAWWLQRDQVTVPAAQPSTAAVKPAANTAPPPTANPPSRTAPPHPQAAPQRPAAPHAVPPKTAPVVAAPVLPAPSPLDRPGSVTPPPAMAAGAHAVAAGAGQAHQRPEPDGPASPLEQAAQEAAAGKARPAPAPPPAAPAPASSPATAARPALPSVWELPYATRKDLPPIELTMHVYASNAADRFVVVKGERHVEGDQIADGVTLRQITADGMVLEFKGQSFTFPRDSR